MKNSIIIVLAAVAVLGAGAWIYWQGQEKDNAPEGAKPRESATPAITLVAPNGGETITEGSVFTIKWKTENIPATYKVSVNIRRAGAANAEGQEFDPLVFVNLDNTGGADWMVSDMYPEGDYILGITAYESIPVTNPVSDESDAPFHIVKGAIWQTYANDKFGYRVDYPNDWVFRQFPDTGTGAGFRPQNSPDDIASECVTVDARGTAENEYNTPFADYVKKAAAVEIQGFGKIDSIAPIMTVDGLTGYEATWIYRDMRGQEKTSLPITYFDNQKAVAGQKYKTVQITLNSEDCRGIYEKMLPTFRLIK